MATSHEEHNEIPRGFFWATKQVVRKARYQKSKMSRKQAVKLARDTNKQVTSKPKLHATKVNALLWSL